MVRLYIYDVTTGEVDSKEFLKDPDSCRVEFKNFFVEAISEFSASIGTVDAYGGVLWAIYDANLDVEETDHEFDEYINDRLIAMSAGYYE